MRELLETACWRVHEPPAARGGQAPWPQQQQQQHGGYNAGQAGGRGGRRVGGAFGTPLGALLHLSASISSVKSSACPIIVIIIWRPHEDVRRELDDQTAN